MNATLDDQAEVTDAPGGTGERPGRRGYEDETAAELVGAAGRGDDGAWRSLVRRFDGRVRAIARSFGLGHADVADISQAVWLRLFDNHDRIRNPERVGAWLAATARNECLALLERRNRVTPTADDTVLDAVHAPNPLAAVEAEEHSEALTRLIGTLPAPHQSMMRMLLLDPMPSYRTISETLGIPHGSIGPTRQRCLSALRVRCSTSAGELLRVA